MTYFAVFDTNILVSSLLTKSRESATSRVVDEIASGRIIPLYNDEILEEYEDVLHRDKFPFKDSDVRSLIDSVREMGVCVNPSPTGEILPDMDDLVFYEVAMEKRDDDAYLITGNMKHFPERNYIVTPAEMMKILDGQNMQLRDALQLLLVEGVPFQGFPGPECLLQHHVAVRGIGLGDGQ